MKSKNDEDGPDAEIAYTRDHWGPAIYNNAGALLVNSALGAFCSACSEWTERPTMPMHGARWLCSACYRKG